MFTLAAQPHYLKTYGREHLWQIGEGSSIQGLVAGALLGSEIIRVRFLRGATFDESRYQLADGGVGTLPYHSWAVAKGDEQWPELADEKEARAIITPYLQGFSFSPDAIRLTRPLTSQERVYGLGERTGNMNKRGQSFPVWNIDPQDPHTDKTISMYTSIPLYLGLRMEDNSRCYGVFIDHTGQVEMDLGRTRDSEASMTVQGDTLVAYFFFGPTSKAVLRQYTELAGRMPLPPRWALGYHQSRWGYASEQSAREVASRLRAGNHPCDALWLDIDYMDGYRDFTWNPEAFPNPKALIDDLHAQGFHLVTIVDPGTKLDENYVVYQQGMERDYFCHEPDGAIFQGQVWPGTSVFPDYSRNEVRTWWGNLQHRLLDQGVDGIWDDMNEPALTDFMVNREHTQQQNVTMDNAVLHRAGDAQPTGPDGPPVTHTFFHNAYGMEMARASREGLARLRPDTRPFVLTRSGTAGIQRYAAIWTGDNSSTWEHIHMAMPMCLNLSMSGVPFVGVDLGGFWNNSNGELLVRFAQLAALLPFCRNHSAVASAQQEPWAFGETYENAYREAIETRYRLLPYLYTLFHEASATGAPIIRPLYYHYPQYEQAADVQSQFLVGEVLLSAPVYEEGATSRRVYLPAGTWLDYWDQTEYQGEGWSEIAAPLNRWPLFVRGNSIVPTGPLMQHTEQHPTDPLTITCYMTENGQTSYTLYEDDGRSLAYQGGAFARTMIACRLSEGGTIVEIEEWHEAYRPQREWYEIVVYAGGRTARQRVRAGQRKVSINL